MTRIVRAIAAAARAAGALLPETMGGAGAAFVIWAAWGVDPRLGQLTTGLILLWAAHALARTEKGPANG